LKFGVLAVAALIGLASFAACGGGDDKTFSAGDGEVTISDDLPDEFPDDFPQYGGADFQGSYQGESQGVSGLVATWTTDDSAEDVLNFGNTGSQGGFLFARNSDTSKVAAVYVGSDGGNTSISVIISDDEDVIPDDGSGDETPDDGDSSGDSGDDSGDGSSSGDGGSAAQLPDEQDLSDDYPADRVPLPGDIRVTSSSALATGGVESFYVEFYSQQSADEIADFFKNELPGKGWTETLTSESGGEIYLSFGPADSANSSSIVTIIISEAEVEGYRLVNLSVVGA
jgi:hypothetical protein